MSSTRTTPGLVQRSAGTVRHFRHLLHEGAKFLIVGLIGIGVTNLVFIPLHGPLGLGPLKSVTIATIVATAVTFLGNRYWSFRHREGAGTAKEGLTFFFLNGIGLLIQYAVLGFSNYALGLTTKIENVIALNLGIGLGTLFRFWSYRKWVWVPPKSGSRNCGAAGIARAARQAVAAESEPAVVGARQPQAGDSAGAGQLAGPPRLTWAQARQPRVAASSRFIGTANAAAPCRLVSAPVATSRLMTWPSRDRARAGRSSGSYADGAWTRPASTADCGQDSSAWRTSEVAAARRCQPVIPVPEVGDIGVHARGSARASN